MAYKESFIEELSDAVIKFDKKYLDFTPKNIATFGDEIISIIIKYNNISMESFKVVPDFEKCSKENVYSPAGVIPANNQLLIYYAGILQCYGKEGYILKTKDRISFLLYIIYILSHELNHIENIESFNNSESSIQKVIIREAYETFANIPSSYRCRNFVDLYKGIRLVIFFKKAERLYNLYHDYSPLERVANIENAKLYTAVAQFMELDDPLKGGQKDLEYAYKYGYKNNRCPTEVFYTKVNNKLAKKEPEYVKFVDYNEIKQQVANLTFEERVHLGVEITNEELDEKIHQLIYKKEYFEK